LPWSHVLNKIQLAIARPFQYFCSLGKILFLTGQIYFLKIR